jgi:hypothetical protein
MFPTASHLKVVRSGLGRWLGYVMARRDVMIQYDILREGVQDLHFADSPVCCCNVQTSGVHHSHASRLLG